MIDSFVELMASLRNTTSMPTWSVLEIKNYAMPLNLRRITNMLTAKFSTSCPDQFNYEKDGVVYQFKCKFCASSYIGKTCRPFYQLYKEHSYSIFKKNFSSALPDHVQICADCKSIDDFSFTFICWSSDPVEVSLLEARMIDLLDPSLNRRHEGAGLTRLEIR